MRLLLEARGALQTKTATTGTDNHELTERLLSHFEAGPSTAEGQDPLLQTLRAQKLALSLLHRGIQLPASLLDKVGGSDVPNQVRMAGRTAFRSTLCNVMITCLW